MSEIRVTHREKTLEQIYAEPDPHGNLGYWVGVSIDGVEQQKGVLVRHKGDRDIMQVGDTFDQHGFAGIQPTKSKGGNEYFKAVRPSQNGNSNNGGGGGTRGDLSPEAQARIDATGRAQGRAHAQEMSLRYAAIKVQAGVLNGSFTPETLKPIIDWFYNDAQAAKEQKP